MLEKLELRIKEYEKAIEESAGRHNIMIGAFNEAKNMYQLLLDAEKVAPAIEAAIPAVEATVPAVEDAVAAVAQIA